MNRFLSLFVAIAVVVSGCSSREENELTPTELHLRAYIGFSTELPFELHINGQPIPDADLQLSEIDPDAGPSPISLRPGGPLYSLPTLVFFPTEIGTSKVTLTTVYRGRKYTIPVEGIGDPIPCPAPTDCTVVTFDPETGECDTQPTGNDNQCTSSDQACSGLSRCWNGQCIVRAQAADLCRAPEGTTSIEPSWEYRPPAGHQSDSHSCAIHSDGSIYCLNQYLLDGSKEIRSDLLALRAGGIELWRKPQIILPGTLENFIQVAGDQLLVVSKSDQTTVVNVYDRLTGSSLWILDATPPPQSAEPFIAAGADRIAHVVQREDESFEIRLHARRTGELVGTIQPDFPDTVPPVAESRLLSILADADGNIVTSWYGKVKTGATSFRMDSWAEVLSPLGRQLKQRTVRNNQTYFDVDATAGGRAFTADGFLLDTASLEALGQLYWNRRMDAKSHVVISPNGDGYAVRFGDMRSSECKGWNVRSFDKSGQERMSCHVPVAASQLLPGLLLTEDGGFALLLDGPESATVRVYDAQTRPLSESVLKYHGDSFRTLGRYAASNDQLVVTACASASSSCALVGYSIPGFSLAPHGWVMDQGNPSRTSRPW